MKPTKPMLAHKLTPKRKPPFPFYVQPKLNGIRAFWTGTSLFSRDLKRFSEISLQHLYTQLNDLNFPLDGELYIHGLSLQQINSRVAVKRTSRHASVLEVEYHIFDQPSLLPFQSRWQQLEASLPFASPGWTNHNTIRPNIKLVPTFLINSPVAEEAAYRLFKKQAYEGMMYRSANDPYGFAENCGNKENRWTCLLKRKDWLDFDCTIIDTVEGKGQFANSVGAFVLQTPSGKTFQAGSGLTILQRKAYWEKPPIGMSAKINYEMLSDSGIPLKPTIETIL